MEEGAERLQKREDQGVFDKVLSLEMSESTPIKSNQYGCCIKMA